MKGYRKNKQIVLSNTNWLGIKKLYSLFPIKIWKERVLVLRSVLKKLLKDEIHYLNNIFFKYI
ncbi:hypothetical protein C2L98_16915 [Enterococcus gallinarum]|nr:hypothetical protein C2L98_16915 [Enterococcus gallinarum]